MKKSYLFCFILVVTLFLFQFQLFTQNLNSPLLARTSNLASNQNSNQEKNSVKDIISLFTGKNTSVSGQWFLGFQAGEKDGKEFNYFHLKRGYIDIKTKLSASLSGKITPDIAVDHEGDGEGDIEMRLKYCYLKYSLPGFLIFSKPYFEFGLVHRPWLSFEEHINQYRVQGTMFLERNKILNSADYGITFYSDFGGSVNKNYLKRTGSSLTGKYGCMTVGIYNGGGYHAIEKNKNKTIEGRMTIRPFNKLIPGLLLSYFGVHGKGNTEMATDWTLNKGFISFEEKYFIVTGTYYDGCGNSAGSFVNDLNESLHQMGYSFFSELKLLGKKFSVLDRYDYFKFENESVDKYNERYIVGVAYHFYKKCKVLVDYDMCKFSNSEIKDESVFEAAIEVSY